MIPTLKNHILNYLPKYKKILNITDIHVVSKPKYTNIFRRIMPYNIIYQEIIKWFSCGNYDMAKSNLLLSFITISKINGKTPEISREPKVDVSKLKDELYMKPDFSEEDGIKASELEVEFAELNGWEAESEASELLNNLGVEVDLHYLQMKELPSRQTQAS